MSRRFAGLSAFQEADAERYVGRECEIVGLVGRLRNQPLVVHAGAHARGGKLGGSARAGCEKRAVEKVIHRLYDARLVLIEHAAICSTMLLHDLDQDELAVLGIISPS